MLLFIVLLVAAVMAVFAAIGVMRMARASLILLAAMTGGLVTLRVFGPRLVALANIAARFLWGGGFGAVAASDPGRALAEVLSSTSGARPFIDPNYPAPFYLLVLLGFVLVGAGLSSLRSLRPQGRLSVGGLLLGLVNGYILSAYLVAVLFPEFAILPLPIQIRGIPSYLAPWGHPAGGPVDIQGRLLESLADLADSPSLPLLVAGIIVAFIVMASRLSARKG